MLRSLRLPVSSITKLPHQQGLSLPALLQTSCFASSKAKIVKKKKTTDESSSKKKKTSPSPTPTSIIEEQVPKVKRDLLISPDQLAFLSKNFSELSQAYRSRDEGADFFRSKAYSRASDRVALLKQTKVNSSDKDVTLQELKEYLNLKDKSSIWTAICEALGQTPIQKGNTPIDRSATRPESKSSKKDQQAADLKRKDRDHNRGKHRRVSSPQELFSQQDEEGLVVEYDDIFNDPKIQKNNDTNTTKTTTTPSKLKSFRNDPFIQSSQFISGILGFGAKAASAISNLVLDEGKRFPKIKSITDIDTFRKVLDKILLDYRLQDKLSNKYAYRKLFPLKHNQLLGLKYYEDLKERIPREEVEVHEQILLQAAKRAKLEMQICGSFRRMKPTCGDVDCIIWSKEHQNQYEMNRLLSKFLESLDAGYMAKTKQEGNDDDKKKKSDNNSTIETDDESKKSTNNNYIVDSFATGDRKFMGLCKLPTEAPEIPGQSKAEREKMQTILKKFASKNNNKNTNNNNNKTRRLDIRVVPKQLVAPMVLYFTGSASHNVYMRQVAIQQKMLLNEYGLFNLGKKRNQKKMKEIPVSSEEDIFKKLGMKYKKPEERE